MKKILSLVLLSMTLLISGCGDESYTECKLREFQKCRTKNCESAAESYCRKATTMTQGECADYWIETTGLTFAQARKACDWRPK